VNPMPQPQIKQTQVNPQDTTAALGDLDLGLSATRPDNCRIIELVANFSAAVNAGENDKAMTLAKELVGAVVSKPMHDDDLLSVSEVAQSLSCSCRTVWRRVAAGELPHPVPDGGRSRWLRKDLHEYLERIKAKRGKVRK
jgi:excisionase family DNA binding protein